MKAILAFVFFVCLWIYATYGFVSEELLGFLIEYKSLVFFFCDITIVFCGLLVIRKVIDIVFIVFFVLFTFYTHFLVNGLSFVQYLNGQREFISFVFAIPLIRFLIYSEFQNSSFELKMDKFITVFLFLQIPCSIVQFLRAGASDAVGGSMGLFYSGVLTQLIFTMGFYKICRRYNSSPKVWRSLLYFIPFFIPVFINETKLIFVLFPLLFISLFHFNRKGILRLFLVLPIFIFVLLPVFAGIYLKATGNTDNIFSIDYYLEFYLVNDYLLESARSNMDQSIDVPRISKIVASVDMLFSNHLIFEGFGLGHFKGGSVLGQTSFARDNNWLVFGSIPYLQFVILQIGIVGFLFICSYLYFIIRPVLLRGVFPYSNNLFFLFFLFCVTLFYNDLFRMAILGIPFVYFLFYLRKVSEKTCFKK